MPEPFIFRLADAIEQHETWLAKRCGFDHIRGHNPAKIVDLVRTPDVVTYANGLIMYPSAAAGHNALVGDLGYRMRNEQTLFDVAVAYRAADVEHWVKSVGDLMGIADFPSDIPLKVYADLEQQDELRFMPRAA